MFVRLSLRLRILALQKATAIPRLAKNDYESFLTNCHPWKTILLIILLKVRKKTTIHHICTNDEECRVCTTTNNGCICHNLNWRTVKKNIRIFISQLVQKFCQTIIKQQFCWVGRNRSYRYNVKIFVSGIPNYNIIKTISHT